MLPSELKLKAERANPLEADPAPWRTFSCKATPPSKLWIWQTNAKPYGVDRTTTTFSDALSPAALFI